MILLSSIVSCSWLSFVSDENYNDVVAGKEKSNIESEWYNSFPEAFKAYGVSGGIETHLFFDPDPEINLSDSSVNFIATTHAGSDVDTQLDTLSGKLYGRRRYCSHPDIYKNYLGSLVRPNYTAGVVPRLLDQIGMPQQIIVFGNQEYYKEREFIAQDKVRVVGGLIEKVCERGICEKPTEWLSHLILVAVDSRDGRYKKVFTLEELKKKVDWKYTSAFLVNSKGMNSLSDKLSPAYQLNGEVRADQSLLFVRSHGHFFNEQELVKIKHSCHKLYDFVWENLGKVGMSKKFRENLRLFGQKFLNRYHTCVDFVRYSNINDDLERHWFMVYFTAFTKIYKLGYYYNCSSKSWSINPVDSRNKRIYDMSKEFKNCSIRKLDDGFGRINQVISEMQKFGKEFVRYVSYDDLAFGSHEKLHSFVSVDGKDINCAEHERDKYNINFKIFPNDIRWRDLAQSLDSKLKNKKNAKK